MAVTLHTLRIPSGSKHRRKRVGRGNASGHGTFSTRGTKGQRARTGGRAGLKKLGMKRIIAALPKSRGFVSLRVKPKDVAVRILGRAFDAGATVTLAALKDKGLVRSSAPAAKLVGVGEVPQRLTVKGVSATPGARASIEKAGGSIKP